MMRRLLAAFLVVAAAALPAVAQRVSDIRGTKHNLSVDGPGTVKAAAGGTSEVCVFCHTPHNATQQDQGGTPLHAPLWNRRVPAGATYTPYTSSTLDAESITSGLDELRVKESDRISAMAAALTGAGSKVTETEDGLTIVGTGGEPLRGSANSRTKTHLDHRIAMSMAVTGLASRDGVEVDDTRPIATSFPQFEALLEEVTR